MRSRNQEVEENAEKWRLPTPPIRAHVPRGFLELPRRRASRFWTCEAAAPTRQRLEVYPRHAHLHSKMFHIFLLITRQGYRPTWRKKTQKGGEPVGLPASAYLLNVKSCR